MKVLVCDDHALMAQVLALHLREQGHEVVVASSPQEALAEQARCPVDVCVLDLVFPGSGTDGAETIRPLLDASPATRVLVLTGYTGSALARRAVAAGAHLLLEKNRSLSAVSAAVTRLAGAGPEAERESLRVGRLQPQLTAREREVLALLVRGQTTAQMGEQLGISVNTVRKHVQRLLEKFGTSSRLEVVALAARGSQTRATGGRAAVR